MMKSQHINSPFARALRQQAALVAKVDVRTAWQMTKDKKRAESLGDLADYPAARNESIQ